MVQFRFLALLAIAALFAIPALAVTEKDFSPAVYNGSETFFIANNLITSPYVLGHDKIFYGSPTGAVHIRLYVSSKLKIKNLFIGVDTHDYPVQISGFKNSITQGPGLPSSKKDIIFTSPAQQITPNLSTFDFDINYDPVTVGFSRKMDFILYDSDLKEVARADPFLGACTARNQLTITNNSSVTIDVNAPLVFPIDPSGWGLSDTTDYNGLKLVYDDGTTATEIYRLIEGSGSDVNIVAGAYADIAPSASDANYFVNYDCGGVTTYSVTPTLIFERFNSNRFHQHITYTNTGFGMLCVLANNRCDISSGQTTGFVTYDFSQDYGWYYMTADIGATGRIYGRDVVDGAGNAKFFKYGTISPSNNEQITEDVDGQTTICNSGTTPTAGVYTYGSNRTGNNFLLWKKGTGVLCKGTNTNLDLNSDQGIGAGIYPTGSMDDVIAYNADANYYDYSGSLSVVVGGAETLPDLNVYYPQNGETFNNATISGIVVDFNLYSATDDSFLVDLNYSGSQTQGTGTAITTDQNTDALTCTSHDFTTSPTCSYTWMIDAVADGNYYILALAKTSLGSAFDAGDNNFNIYTLAPSAIIPTTEYTPYFAENDPRQFSSDHSVYFSPDSTITGTTIITDKLDTLTMAVITVATILIFAVAYIYWKGRK